MQSLFFECQQVPDELERVMVGLQSYLSIRARCNDISFSVFETDEGTSPTEKVSLFLKLFFFLGLRQRSIICSFLWFYLILLLF
jgi:hypothetical protein